MTIEITRDDLLALSEAARLATGNLMLMLKTIDGKRVSLVVTAPARRIRRRRGAGLPLVATEASAD